MSKPVIEANRGASRHGPSIKAPRIYEALRRKGYSKSKAARISNAAANGTLDRHGHRSVAGVARSVGSSTGGVRRSGGKAHGTARSVKRKGASGGHSRGLASAKTSRTMKGGRRGRR